MFSKEIEDRNDVFYNELVPSEGKANTVEGEMLRAINRICYRYFNDGDVFFENYGAETAGPAHTYLIDKSPIKDILKPMLAMGIGKTDDSYEFVLYETLKVVLDYIDSKHGQYTPNTIDCLKCESHFENVWNDSEEDYRADEDLHLPYSHLDREDFHSDG